jgi:acetolactate synthase-1/2/3 large subunit
MGWAIGSSLGVSLSRPGYPVVCITGDGSWLMNGQEITVAVEEKLPIIFLILNDSALGMVKHGQRLTGAEQIGTVLPKSDFAACARAMGASGYNIGTPDDLLNLDVQAILAQGCPTVLDVRIDPDEVPPIGLRTGTLRANG